MKPTTSQKKKYISTSTLIFLLSLKTNDIYKLKGARFSLPSIFNVYKYRKIYILEEKGANYWNS